MQTARSKTRLELHDGKFGERVFRARSRLGYTRDEVAELTNKLITSRTLAAWERSEYKNFRLGKPIRALCEVLGVTIDQLCWGEESINGKR